MAVCEGLPRWQSARLTHPHQGSSVGLPHTLRALGDSVSTALVMQILTSSCVSPWQCPCQTRGPLCSVDLYLLVARRPEAFWEMPRMTLAEGPCSQSLEKWSPGEGRGKERSSWHHPLPKGDLSLRTGMAPCVVLPMGAGPVPRGRGIPGVVAAALWHGADSTRPCASLTLLPCARLRGHIPALCPDRAKPAKSDSQLSRFFSSSCFALLVSLRQRLPWAAPPGSPYAPYAWA